MNEKTEGLNRNTISEVYLDISSIIRVILASKYILIGSAILGFFFGIITYMASDREFIATTSLLSESSGQNQAISTSFFSQLGFFGGAPLQSSDQISVALYPAVVASIPFQKDLIYEEFYIPSVGANESLYDYFSVIQKPNFLDHLKSWTIGLPDRFIYLINVLISPKTSSSSNESTIEGRSEVRINPYIYLTPAESSLIETVNERIKIETSGGIIEVQVKMPDPNLAAHVADYTVKKITEYVTEYRLEKIKMDLSFIEEQLNIAKDRYDKAWIELSEFRETNTGSITTRARKGEQFLESEYQIALSIYQNFSQQYEQTKLEVQEQTPIFRALNPVKIPNSPDGLNLKMSVFVYSTVFILVALLLVLLNSFRKGAFLLYSKS